MNSAALANSEEELSYHLAYVSNNYNKQSLSILLISLAVPEQSFRSIRRAITWCGAAPTFEFPGKWL
jgi:hypothetical protein